MFHETIKVRDLAPESTAWKKVRSSLNQCCVMIGCVSVLSDDEYRLMKDFIMSDYKDFSPEEMLIAFKKLCSGAITVDIEHFGKLSPMYLGAVLKAFKIERNKALGDELRNATKIEVEATAEDKKKIREDYLQNCLIKPYKQINEKGFFDVDKHVSLILWKIFKRAGFINMDDETCDKYLALAIEDLKKDAVKDFNAHKPMKVFMENLREAHAGKNRPFEDKVTDRGRALYFYEYIENLHSKNRSIEEIAKQL